MGRMGVRADVVMTAAAVESVLAAADEGRGSPLLGVVGSDDEGLFYNIRGTGDPIGESMLCPEGGTAPDQQMAAVFSERFPDGILMVVDPYAGEFALYVAESGSLRSASAVVSE